VLVAAAALWLWTRRLQHAAEAAEQAGDTVAAMLWDVPQEDRRAVATTHREVLEQLHGQEHDDTSTARERVLEILSRARQSGNSLPGPTELGRLAGCSKQYAHGVRQEWQARPENQPGQLELADAAA
jgi:hypothetical protein